MRNIRLLLLLMIVVLGCKEAPLKSLLNTSHLDHLYKEIEFNNKKTAFVYIYADYPSYDPFEADGEGIACVDDVARAAIFYYRYFNKTSDKNYLQKAKKLIGFILSSQAENGYYYNFIKSDFTSNKNHINSQAKADWWSWRAMWAISEAMIYAKKQDPLFYDELNGAFRNSLNAIINDANEDNILAILPSDQASLLLMAFNTYFDISSDKKMIEYISIVANSILKSQKGDKEKFPYYAFLSWRNIWHGWGNIQAYSLLKSGQILNDQHMVKAAENEIKYFYSYVLAKNHFKQFSLNEDEELIDVEYFEQIAYAIRPMVWASLELYDITSDSVYALQAGKLAAWLLGKNIAESQMYNPQNGRCYDGINSSKEVNLNSGAESTIEALLTILEEIGRASCRERV